MITPIILAFGAGLHSVAEWIRQTFGNDVTRGSCGWSKNWAKSQIAGTAKQAKTRMRIAIFLEFSHTAGTGGFQQALSTVESLMRNRATEHEFLVFTPLEETRQFLLTRGIEALRFKHGVVRLVDRWSATALGNTVLECLRKLGLRRLGRHLDALLDDHGIDLVLLNEPRDIAWRIGDHPIIVTVWDLDHRDNPEFPEAYADRVFERVEIFQGVTLRRALAVIANSQSYARQIATLYQVDPKRIIVLPFLPSVAVRRHAAGKGLVSAEDARRKYNLPACYVFYPAHFSFHKNHLYLLEGLIELQRRHGVILHAVFSGGGDPPGDQAHVERQAEALGLRDRVRFLGVVPDEDIPLLYQSALALVMPAYFAPTNLPPLEAVSLGCPVVYSDLPGCREQMGSAALYCDLSDPSSLADQLAGLIQDPTLVQRIRKAGFELAAEISSVNYGERLAEILDDYAYVRRRWAWPQTVP